MVHRDLKPHNIFLGEGDVVKIGDFGVSRQLNSSRDMAQTVVGSPGYLSPELCNGDPYNEKTDVWALGVLLSELCALKHPFGDSSSQAALVMKIMRAAPPALPSLYSPQLARLLVCCMQRQPLSRPSALQLLSLSTVQQQAARLDLLQHFPPAALRAGVIAIEARLTCDAAPVSVAEGKSTQPFAMDTSAPRVAPVSTVPSVSVDELNTDGRPLHRCGEAQGASHGRRQGNRHRRPAAGSGDPPAQPTLKGGSGSWELKPVCVERQRRATQSNKTWQSAGSMTDLVPLTMADDDTIPADELGASCYTPPRPAHMASAHVAAWVNGWYSTDGAVCEVGSGRQAAVSSSDINACAARPQDESSHANRRGQSQHPRTWQPLFQLACSHALPARAPHEVDFDERGVQSSAESPRERERSGLWTKRRGAAAAPSLAGKLQVLSLNDGEWEQMSSPVDRFVRQHCPEGVSGRGGSYSPRNGLVIPTTRPEISPLLKLVRQNFPGCVAEAEGQWGDTGADPAGRRLPRGPPSRITSTRK